MQRNLATRVDASRVVRATKVCAHLVTRHTVLAIAFVSAALVVMSACSSSVDGPLQPGKTPSLRGMIVCDANNYCASDGGDDGVGSQTLTGFIHTGCVHDSFQHIAASCQPPSVGGISGWSGGSTYNVAWYQSHCNSPDAEIGPNYCEPFDTLSAGHLVFTNSDYEIDLIAQVQEVGGNGRTGVILAQIMGPASQTLGTEVGCTGANASNDIIYEFPFEEAAYHVDGSPMTDPNGRLLYKDFARNPCTNGVVYSSQDPHPFP